jgi:hypothetical protein
VSVTYPLLLDERFSDGIAGQLRKRRCDVLAVVADPGLIALSDDQILAAAAAAGRALVTANIKDFVPLDAQYKAAGRGHSGLILVSTKTFPQDRSFTGAIVDAIAALLSAPAGVGPDQVVFLHRRP